jgi:hypothetical protein
MNPRKPKLVYVSVLHSCLSEETKRDPEVGKEKKIRLVSSLHACRPVIMMQG